MSETVTISKEVFDSVFGKARAYVHLSTYLECMFQTNPDFIPAEQIKTILSRAEEVSKEDTQS